jgi:hypothetical protein
MKEITQAAKEEKKAQKEKAKAAAEAMKAAAAAVPPGPVGQAGKGSAAFGMMPGMPGMMPAYLAGKGPGYATVGMIPVSGPNIPPQLEALQGFWVEIDQNPDGTGTEKHWLVNGDTMVLNGESDQKYRLTIGKKGNVMWHPGEQALRLHSSFKKGDPVASWYSRDALWVSWRRIYTHAPSPMMKGGVSYHHDPRMHMMDPHAQWQMQHGQGMMMGPMGHHPMHQHGGHTPPLPKDSPGMKGASHTKNGDGVPACDKVEMENSLLSEALEAMTQQVLQQRDEIHELKDKLSALEGGQENHVTRTSTQGSGDGNSVDEKDAKDMAELKRKNMQLQSSLNVALKQLSEVRKQNASLMTKIDTLEAQVSGFTIVDNSGIAEAMDEESKKLMHMIDTSEFSEFPASTLMICNIPCRLGRPQIEEAIADVGYGDAYGFMYIPNRKNASDGNMGYAFVEFNTAELAKGFTDVFNGHRFKGTNSTKECIVKPAHHQGFNGEDAAAMQEFAAQKAQMKE